MKVAIHSIQFQFGIACASAGVDQIVRFGLVVDKQANGTLPAYANIFTTSNAFGLRELAYRTRYKILYDKLFTLNRKDEAGSKRVYKLYMKLKRPIHTEYNIGLTDAYSAISSNSLWLYTFGTEAAGTTSNTIIGNIRIRYTDM